MRPNNYQQQAGIALLFTVLILGTLLIVASTMAGVVLRIGSFSRTIGKSEVALLAAESAVEQGLYVFERGGKTLSSLTGSGVLTDIPEAAWTLSAWASSTIPLGAAGLSAGSSNEDPISATNPLVVTLSPGQAFELNLDLVGVAYPNQLDINWANDAVNRGKIFWYSSTLGNQASTTKSLEARVPPTASGLTLNAADSWRSKVVNQNSTGGSNITFTITPGGSNQPLPLKAVISAHGFYQDQEREIQVERPLWVIYP